MFVQAAKPEPYKGKGVVIKMSTCAVRKVRLPVRNSSGKGEYVLCLRKYLETMKDYVVTHVYVRRSVVHLNAHV